MFIVKTLECFGVAAVIASALAFSAFAAADIQTAPAKAAVCDYTTIRLDPEAIIQMPKPQTDEDGNQYYITGGGIILTIEKKGTDGSIDTVSILSFVPDDK